MDIIEEFKKIVLPEAEPLGYTFKGGNNVLLSAPHAVTQTRNGKTKFAETETYNLIKLVANLSGASLIAKTSNLGDDANFDFNSNYRNKIAALIENKQINFLLDIHCLNNLRSQQINLGTNNKFNLVGNTILFSRIEHIFKKFGFETTEDYPFRASEKTIAGFFSKTYNVFALQIEINSSIFKNEKDLKNLINALTEIVKGIITYNKVFK